jgi:hypothetical protein
VLENFLLVQVQESSGIVFKVFFYVFLIVVIFQCQGAVIFHDTIQSTYTKTM